MASYLLLSALLVAFYFLLQRENVLSLSFAANSLKNLGNSASQKLAGFYFGHGISNRANYEIKVNTASANSAIVDKVRHHLEELMGNMDSFSIDQRIAILICYMKLSLPNSLEEIKKYLSKSAEEGLDISIFKQVLEEIR